VGWGTYMNNCGDLGRPPDLCVGMRYQGIYAREEGMGVLPIELRMPPTLGLQSVNRLVAGDIAPVPTVVLGVITLS
jgi:hypothetical protein